MQISFEWSLISGTTTDKDKPPKQYAAVRKYLNHAGSGILNENIKKDEAQQKCL